MYIRRYIAFPCCIGSFPVNHTVAIQNTRFNYQNIYIGESNTRIAWSQSTCLNPRYNITGYAYVNDQIDYNQHIIEEQVDQAFIDINNSELLTDEGYLVAFNVSSIVNSTQCYHDNRIFLLLNGKHFYVKYSLYYCIPIFSCSN